MDLTDLRLFLAVVEAGSITRGGERAGLSLAAASARVRDLEAHAGVALLVRGRRGVVPTAAGEGLARHARVVLRHWAVLQGELDDHARRLTGAVRVQANTAALAAFLPEVLADFLAHSEVGLDLEERPSPAIVRAVLEDQADLGIAADSADATGLEAHVLRDDRLLLVVPQGHPLAGAQAVWFADALSESFIGLGHDRALQRLLARHALRAGRGIRMRARLPGLDGVCRMVARGAGVAVLPAAAVPTSLPVARVGLRDAWSRRRLLLLTRGVSTLSPPARLLYTHLKAASGEAAPPQAGGDDAPLTRV